MKNLLWIVHAGLGQRGSLGAPTFWKTVEGFLADGWKIWMIDAGTGLDTPVGVETWDDGLYIQRFQAPMIRLFRVRKLGTLIGPLRQWLIMRRLHREAERLIRREGLDRDNTVLYAHEVTAVLPGKKLSRRYGFPMVTRFYGVWDIMGQKDTPLNRLRLFPKFEAYETPADLVIITDDGTKGDELMGRMGNRSPFVFWRNGVDELKISGETPSFVDRLAPDDRILMTLSRLHPDKKVDRAIRVLAQVLPRIPKAKLVVCGYGLEKDNLEKLAVELGVADSVIFVGRVDHDRIADYLSRADVFLSLWEVSNLGNPLFEAMRCGRAIVTLDVGITGTVIHHGENGLLIPPGDLAPVADAVCKLLEQPALAEKLGTGARRYASEHFWTWEERVAAEIRAVNDLLAKGEK